MNARSALFDLYGDHLASRGGRAPVAALVRLLGELDIAAPAVRTAVSRMVRQGWLAAVRLPGGPGYALTPRAVRRLDEAATRIYRTREPGRDETWHVVVLPPIRERSARDRLRSGLRYLGYGALDDSTWVAARPSSELAGLLAAEAVAAETFSARHDGNSAAMVRRVWDLEALGAAYQQWLASARTTVELLGPDASDAEAFAARSQLVHDWRKFLFVDPNLPDRLLPADWPGRVAARYFDEQAVRLLPAAGRFIDSCLDPDERST
ncbi:MAG TPA: PaaX family transcriptional regulator C-terminal domain-containing protein [Mycobacteriales bacterium]|nr:PaaX family transcriptional regulator C-terminal domain-containing protein [Mycobacteriales bacterium]